MTAESQKEHQWLQRLVGEWTYEGETVMSANEPPMKSNGTESVRALGDFWILAEGQGAMCGGGGGSATTLMTLGYDPAKKRYVGTWVGSMMSNLWVYDGSLDGAVLTLESEGPHMTAEGQTAKYRDVIEIKTDDHRVMTGNVLGDDGKWQTFMTAHYRRKK